MGKAPLRKKSATTRATAADRIADQIIALLDQGQLPPWQRPWQYSQYGTPRNAVSGRPYRGINRWLTQLAQDQAGYLEPRWLTLRQANAAGGRIKAGAQSTQIVFWKLVNRKTETDPETTGTDTATTGKEHDTYPIARLYRVFNLEQTVDCTLPALAEFPSPPDPIAAAEAIIGNMPHAPEFITYDWSNQPPHYLPRQDCVRVPSRQRYAQTELYYNTVYHELTHATGHPRRLNRFTPEQTPDLHTYGVEELVAGMGAAMLSDTAGLRRATLEVDAAYLDAWSRTIKAERSIVLKAAQQAQRAHDYIVPRTPAGADDSSVASCV